MNIWVGLTLCILTGLLLGLIPLGIKRKSAERHTPSAAKGTMLPQGNQTTKERKRLSKQLANCGLVILMLISLLICVGCIPQIQSDESEQPQTSQTETVDTTEPTQEVTEGTTEPTQEVTEGTTEPSQEVTEGTTEPSQEATEDTTVPTDAIIEGTTEDGYAYQMNADKTECIITGYTGAETVLEIPDTVDEVPVTIIGEKAFAGLDSIIRVTFHPNMKEIRDQAFSGCSSLAGFLNRSQCTAAASAFDGCGALRYAIVLDETATLDGWTLPGDLHIYKRGMETGIGKLDSIPMISPDGVIYGRAENDQAVVLYIPGDITETTITDKFEFADGTVYPVIWIYEDALDDVEPSAKITLPADTLFPYPLWNRAQWRFNAEGGDYTTGDCTPAQCWYLSCVACDSINGQRPDDAPQILPDETLLRAAMLRAEELVISDDIQWRPDDFKWDTILDDFEISCRYAVTWKNTMPAYDTGVSEADLTDIFRGLTEAYAPMVEEWQEYYTDLCIGLSYDAANARYQLSCLIIVK